MRHLLFLFIFTLSSCGGGSAGNDPLPVEEDTARDCQDKDLLKNTDNTWKLTYETFQNGSVSAVIVTKTFHIDSLNAEFSDQKELTVLSLSETQITPGTIVTENYKSYFRLGENSEKTVYGYINAGQLNISSWNNTEYYNPAYTDSRYNLKSGETLKFTITGRFVKNSYYPGSPGREEGVIERAKTIKYVGKDAITTQVGQLKACKFIIDDRQEWVWRGFPIQEADNKGEITRRVKEITLNNAAILP
ncbi:hypothetical protein [Diaphorobacter nitroreducens]|uniref:hypothetical protein n=1 Tax=Diaphorobacter nitroreducens TaxID=164759 RepID=UPI0028A7BA1B|nr:hypothetical protein [Diaphorobacter nitroreducens]